MTSLLRNLALASFSLLFTLAMLEGATRVMKLGTGGFWEPHKLLGWRNIAGASGWESCYGECRVYVTINSLGLHDREIPYEKPEGVQRIFFLGDSITAGMQVPLEDTFVKQLESHLAASLPHQSWEVINGAVNGYGTDNELLFYRLEGVKYDPDIVILSIYLANDIYNNHRVLELRTGGQGHKPYFTLDEAGELVLNNYPVENTDTLFIRMGTFLKKHFQLPRFIAQTMSLRGQVPDWMQPIMRLFSGNRGVPSFQREIATADQGETGAETTTTPQDISGAGATVCDETYSKEIIEAWDVTKAIIRQMRDEVEATGAQFAVLSVPTTAQTITPKPNAFWYCERPNEQLNNFLEEEVSFIWTCCKISENIVQRVAPIYITSVIST